MPQKNQLATNNLSVQAGQPLKTNVLIQGFTLVEILVGIAIMTILFGLGFLNFRDFSRRQTLKTFARRIEGDLSLAREKAISGEKPDVVVCNSPNILNGYSFQVASSENYVIKVVCSGGTIVVKNEDTPVDLTIGSSVPGAILFKVLSKGTDLSSDATITVSQTSTGRSETVIIYQTGEIE